MSCGDVQFDGINAVGSIQSVSPAWLSRGGGETLTIRGDFKELDKPLILIDGKACSNLSKISETELSCISPSNGQIKNADVLLLNSKSKKIAGQFSVKYVGVLGQKSTRHNVHLAQGLSGPLGIKKIGDRILIGDIGNARIVGLSDLTGVPDRDFNYCLGAADVSARHRFLTVDRGRYRPRDFSFENGLLMFADRENHRVLIFNGVPSRWDQQPLVVIGQPDALSTVANNGGLSDKSLNAPMSATFVDGRIYVADAGNNRVLIWNSVPTTNFAPADGVLGQPSFLTSTANNGGLSASSLNAPFFIDRIGTKLFVTDHNNRRILVWNTPPLSTTPADSVLGQASFTAVSTTPSASVFRGPGPVKYAGNKLFVSDYLGNRVLVFKNFDPNIPVMNGLSADIVLGQPDFASTSVWRVNSKITAQSLANPWGIEVDGNTLLIVDQANHRVLIYDHLPDDSVADQHQPATRLIGQPSMNIGLGNRSNAPGAQYLPAPSNVGLFEGRFLVNSESTGRISVWNSVPETDFQPADFVLGQTGFSEDDQLSNRGLPSPTESTLSTPYQMLSFGNKLYVSDNGNNRVLIWNSLSGNSGQPADLVIGQSNFTTSAFSPISASSLRGPTGLDVINDKLVVSDRGNNRFMIYGSPPVTNGEAATDVVGQTAFSLGGSNGSTATVSGSTFHAPFNSVSWLGNYVVSDHLNRRILIWRSFDDFLSGQEAAAFWGQDNLTSVDSVTTGPNRISSFMIVKVVDDRLYATDPLNSRIIVFDKYTEPTLTPSAVLGQNSLTEQNRAQEIPYSADVLNTPVNYLIQEDRIYIPDYDLNRVIILPR